MKNGKNILALLLTILLAVLQPVVSYGNVPSVLTSVIDLAEETSLFKTKSSKALVFEEVQPTTATPKVLLKAFKNPVSDFIALSERESLTSVASGIFLIDFRNILTTQIFPFHFFL